MHGTCIKIKAIFFSNNIKNYPETSGGISSKQANVLWLLFLNVINTG